MYEHDDILDDPRVGDIEDNVELQEAIKDLLTDDDMGYIGVFKPKVEHVREPSDPYSYKRFKAAQKLGVSPDELPDEPDNLPESAEQADWSDIND